jgi:hypothetical protein
MGCSIRGARLFQRIVHVVDRVVTREMAKGNAIIQIFERLREAQPIAYFALNRHAQRQPELVCLPALLLGGSMGLAGQQLQLGEYLASVRWRSWAGTCSIRRIITSWPPSERSCKLTATAASRSTTLTPRTDGTHNTMTKMVRFCSSPRRITCNLQISVAGLRSSRVCPTERDFLRHAKAEGIPRLVQNDKDAQRDSIANCGSILGAATGVQQRSIMVSKMVLLLMDKNSFSL